MNVSDNLDYELGPSKRLIIHEAIRSVLPFEPNVAVFHSSLLQYKTYDRDLKWHILSLISNLVDEGWTLLFPSFTFSFFSGKPFIKFESSSETGVLADLVLENLSNSTRTNSPIYSFVVIGNRSDEVLSLEPKTTFGSNSPFEWFEKVNATIVMLGCDWKYCTQFHRYEELSNVEYRYLKTFNGMADYGNDLMPIECSMFVRDLDLNPLNDFTEAINTIDKAGRIKKAKLLGGSIQSVAVRDIQNTCLEDLSNNPFAYISNEGEVKKNIRDRSEKNSQPILKVSLLGQKNLEIVVQALKNHLSFLVPERRFDFLNIPYGQLYKKLYDKDDELNTSPPDIKIFADRLEDLPGFNPTDPEKTLFAVEEYVDLIQKFHQDTGGWSIVSLFASIERPISSADSLIHNDTVSRANSHLKNSLKHIQQIAWIDMNSEISMYDGVAIDSRLSFLGQFPWSSGFSDYLAHSLASLIITILGKDVRLMIVDLDNTLWSGVVGEDGLQGLEIGGDYPGNAFKAFQELILKYSKRGVALALASKNDEDIALKAISELPDMVIREHHLQCHAINWEPKWRNIIKICDNLNLGLASVLFIDDNPIEREEVKRNLPDVKVLSLPNDPADYVRTLKSCAHLRPINLTKEDLGRLQDFSVRREREQTKASSSSLEDYYSALEITLSLNSIDKRNAQRAAQLCQKTNQFNSTTRRYDQKQLFDLANSGNDLLVINYADKFSPAENIGLLVIKYPDTKTAFIDLYLLSCRVLGRGIETVIPNLAASIAGEKGCDRIVAEMLVTERNTPVRNVFKDAGFLKKEETLWQSAIQKKEFPSWIKYELNLEA